MKSVECRLTSPRESQRRVGNKSCRGLETETEKERERDRERQRERERERERCRYNTSLALMSLSSCWSWRLDAVISASVSSSAMLEMRRASDILVKSTSVTNDVSGAILLLTRTGEQQQHHHQQQYLLAKWLGWANAHQSWLLTEVYKRHTQQKY